MIKCEEGGGNRIIQKKTAARLEHILPTKTPRHHNIMSETTDTVGKNDDDDKHANHSSNSISSRALTIGGVDVGLSQRRRSMRMLANYFYPLKQDKTERARALGMDEYYL